LKELDVSPGWRSAQAPARPKAIIRKREIIIEETLSVCPVCLKRIGAKIIRRGDDYFMTKRCDEHGAFSAVIWRGSTPAIESWGNYAAPEDAAVPNCPSGCGLCPSHRQKTCCALVEVTRRCNLHCPVCFAAANGAETADTAARAGTISGEGLRASAAASASASVSATASATASASILHSTDAEPSVRELSKIFKTLADAGNTFIHLSGGEPTVRDDLPDIVAAARDAGCETIQLNSNGVRLGSDPAYTKALKEAGLSFVFMQFDGVNDAIYETLRGEALFSAKRSAIKVCGKNLLGVTLVPTIVPGVNDSSIGEIIDFGLRNSPDVRGVHFQPVSYFGRYPCTPQNSDRITLPEILRAIETQSNKRFSVTDFAPSSCDHPRCGFHGDFVVLPNLNILKIRNGRTDAASTIVSESKSAATSAPASALTEAPASVSVAASAFTSASVSKPAEKSSCCCDDAHLRNRSFIARRWTRTQLDSADAAAESESSETADYQDMNAFLRRIKSHGFTISAMAFQDAYTLDINRLRQCSLHVTGDGNTIVPFCAKYLTAAIS